MLGVGRAGAALCQDDPSPGWGGAAKYNTNKGCSELYPEGEEPPFTLCAGALCGLGKGEDWKGRGGGAQFCLAQEKLTLLHLHILLGGSSLWLSRATPLLPQHLGSPQPHFPMPGMSGWEHAVSNVWT